MVLRGKVLICLLIASLVGARPTDDGDDYTLDEEIVPLIESRSSFDYDEVEVEDVGLEQGTLFQGDIYLLDDQKEILMKNLNDSGPLSTRTGIISEDYRWFKNDYGFVVVPFEFARSSRYSLNQKAKIINAMNTMERYTCVRFVERSYENDYIKLHSGDGCSSRMGRSGGMQEISLQKNGCLSSGTIVHELIHALGYDHMHSSADRDNYVSINYNNIRRDAISNFDLDDPRVFSNFGTKYDLYSVMHYDKKAFSKNGRETIIPRNRRFSKVIGQRVGMSKNDVKRINNMYRCFGN